MSCILLNWRCIISQQFFKFQYFLLITCSIKHLLNYQFQLILLINIKMSQQIVIAREQHALSIARFQINMALQTQNFKLDPQIVEKAVNYIISLRDKSQSSQLGFYLVKQLNGKAIASLLLTFQSQQRWWIQSVYVQKQYRRQGHFTSLFNKATQIAKQKGVQSVKLYAQTENLNAKQTYFKLGMSLVEGKIYSYDFVYGGSTLHQQGSQQYQFESNHQQITQISKWLQQKQNRLSKVKTLVDSHKGLVVIRLDGNLIGAVRYFEQFSDWRFGIMRYVRQIYLDQSCPLEEIVSKLTSYLVKTSQIKVAAVRFIVSEQLSHRLKGGHLQHYDILQIKLQ